MISNKALFSCFLLLLLSSLAMAQAIDSTAVASTVPLQVQDSTLVSKQEIQVAVTDTVVQPKDSTLIPSPLQNTIAQPYPPLRRDWRRLGYTTSMYLGTTVIAFGVLWVMPESVTNWDKEEIKEKGLLWKWKENVKAGPVWDEDDWVLNWITHPYCGGLYYMTARTNGFTVLESFGYSAIMSTFFWEYGIEAFAEVPSIQDLVITPVFGSMVGEGFLYAKKSILRHDKKVLKSRFLGITTLFFMDPFNTILDGCGYKDRVKTQMNVAPVGVNQFTGSSIWGVQFSARF